ncbi:hypothetical protein D3C80_2110920 [compost metagenome]
MVHGIGAVDHLAIREGPAKRRLDLLRNELQIDDDGAFCGHSGTYWRIAVKLTASRLKAAAISAFV